MDVHRNSRLEECINHAINNIPLKTNVFIETGLKRGEGIKSALLFKDFKKVHSIEIYDEFVKTCEKKFNKDIREGRLNLICGDSAIELNKLIQNIDEPIMYWLDAHGGPLKKKINENPLLDEINIINKNGKSCILLVDDIGKPNYKKTTNRNLDYEDVKKKLLENNWIVLDRLKDIKNKNKGIFPFRDDEYIELSWVVIAYKIF